MLTPRKHLDDDRMRELYTTKRLTTWQIAAEMGIAQATVCEHLRRMGILRTKQEAQRVRYSGQPHKRLEDNGHGYAEIFMPEHPNARANGYLLEHRYIMSHLLGRPLQDDEVVHHINGDPKDNRIGNLRLMRHGQHSSLMASPESDEDLLEALRDLARRLGKVPAATDCTARNGVRSVPVYIARFGSWNHAKVLAGVGLSKTGPRLRFPHRAEPRQWRCSHP